jgi:stage IV sporulation protein FB
MEQSHWQLGTWRRIPVSMHWTVLLVFVWLYLIFGDLLTTAIASAAFFSLLVVHEFGHVAVLRARRISVESIELSGLHGRTSHGWASAPDEILVAWGGVAAQLVVLLLAVAAGYLLDLRTSPVAATIVGPILFVFTRVNFFLMLVALLPIGPFDGHAAWAVIPWLRKKIRKRRQVARDIKLFPEKGLSPEKRRELEESSTKAASELMEKLAKKPTDRKEDA